MAAEDTWTLRRIVRWISEDLQKRGVSSPRLDAELLAAHALGIDRVRLYMDLDRPLDDRELSAIRELVPRRRKREPMAYILGRREFWGLSLKVSPAVLIPRPETELLVELSLALLPKPRRVVEEPEPAAADATLEVPVPVAEPEPKTVRLLDLCTGSGCVAVAIAHERPEVHAIATDLSADALAVAKENVAAHGLDARVTLRQGDLFAPVVGETFDIVTANPPYLAAAELTECEPDVKDYEPRLALVADREGLAIVERIAAGLGAHLAPGGHAFVEVGAGQAKKAAALFEKQGFVTRIHPDLAKIERVVEARR